MKAYICFLCLLMVTHTAPADASRASTIAQSCNHFSQHLYKKIVLAGSKNSIYSPLSIHQALSMTTLGARGDTATELSHVLGLNLIPFGANQPHLSYLKLIKKLHQANYVEILTANAIFINPKIRIYKDFIKKASSFYHAQVSNFNLHEPFGPEKKINDFVESKTRGLIKGLLQPGTVGGSTVMVLINTLYFNGTWLNPFSEKRTKKADFHTQHGTIQVDTMFGTKTINIKRHFHGADVGQLVFRGERFSLVIVLPHTVNGLSAQETRLTSPTYIDSLFDGLIPTRADVSLPKVKIESRYDLNSALRTMGIVKAFDPRQANFHGISSKGGIFISKVVHKAVIDITETGTVAAAATMDLLSRNSFMEPPTETFYVDHPFLYFLYDSELRLILFQGRFSE